MGFFSEIGDFLHNPVDYVGDAFGDFSQEATKDSWNYQTSNAYQNTVKDMRNAGLNPMLAYLNGSNSASVSAPSFGSVMSAAGTVADFLPGRGGKTDYKQRDLETSQIEKNEAEIVSALASARLSNASTAKVLEETAPLARKNKRYQENPSLVDVEVGRDLMGQVGAGAAVVQNVIKDMASSAKDYQQRMDKFKRNLGNYGNLMNMPSH